MTQNPHHLTQNRAASVLPKGDPGHGSGEPALDLEGVRRRDPDALAALFERYFDRLFGLVYRMLGDRAAAEDAIQEVFLKIHRGAPSLDPTRDPGPWLVTIAANVCRDLWRSSAHRMDRSSSSIEGNPALGEHLASGAHNPERDLLSAERERAVQGAILKLRPSSREIILLREYEGLGYDRIAEITGANETTVRKRYSRALEELGSHLKKAGL